jgi:hypothetical protein
MRFVTLTGSFPTFSFSFSAATICWSFLLSCLWNPLSKIRSYVLWGMKLVLEHKMPSGRQFLREIHSSSHQNAETDSTPLAYRKRPRTWGESSYEHHRDTKSIFQSSYEQNQILKLLSNTCWSACGDSGQFTIAKHCYWLPHYFCCATIGLIRQLLFYHIKNSRRRSRIRR